MEALNLFQIRRDDDPYLAKWKRNLIRQKMSSRQRMQKNPSKYRSSKERITGKQAQALWTFFVAIAVAIAALMQMGQRTKIQASDLTPALKPTPTLQTVAPSFQPSIKRNLSSESPSQALQ